MTNEKLLAHGVIERIGTANALLNHWCGDDIQIKKVCEISCNECGQAEPDYGSLASLERSWKGHGWIFCGNRHFCDKKCAEAYNRKISTEEVTNE